MKSRMYGVLTASLGAIVLMVAANEAFAASRGTSHGGVSSFSRSHRFAGHFRHRHGLQQQGAFIWPGDVGDYGYGYGPVGEPLFNGTQPLPADVGNSNASDIPWDWAHRYPPMVTPSGRPYVSTCASETMTVPNSQGGTGQVNIIRCY